MTSEILNLIHSSSFYEFAALLVLAAVAGSVGSFLRQPLIVAFIVIGVLVGPSALGIVQSGNEILLLAKLGIAVLLFIVGLKLDLGLIKSLGAIATTIGLVQISLTVLLGAGISFLLGFSINTAFLIGVALSFSSTIIIIKILSDKREIDSLHGQIALGVLIIQDLVVVFSMIILATLSAPTAGGIEVIGETPNLMEAFLQIILYTAGLLAAIFIFMRFAALKVVSFMAKNQELLVCFAIAWAVMLAAICDIFGLSKELGGLLAGISLASTPFREAIISRLSSLRDFLLLFFFISLGIQIDLAILGSSFVPALILSIFVLLFKPFIIMTLSGSLNYNKRTSFLAGLSLGQISEFSLIFAAMAYSSGFISQDSLAVITLVGLITIITSTYMLSLSQTLYALFEAYLDVFEKKKIKHREQEDNSGKFSKKYDIILFGLGRYGQVMMQNFLDKKQTVLAVDFNPVEVKKWKEEGFDVVYGDAHDPEFFHILPLKNAKWVISALPPQHARGITHEDPRLVILSSLKDLKYKGNIALACHSQDNADQLIALGADIAFLPFHDAAQKASEIVMSMK